MLFFTFQYPCSAIINPWNVQHVPRGRVVCALDYEAGDPGSIPGSGGGGGATNWLFSAGW